MDDPCLTCQYKRLNAKREKGHCYMFRDKPPQCGQYRPVEQDGLALVAELRAAYDMMALAAKAANYPIEGWTHDKSLGMRWVDENHEFVRYWNPFINDGDIYRLLVDLKISYVIDEKHNCVRAWAARPQPVVVISGTDDLALRRAVLQVAAEIGERKGRDEY